MIFCKVEVQYVCEHLLVLCCETADRPSVIPVMLPVGVGKGGGFQGSAGQRGHVGLYGFSRLIEMLVAGYTHTHTH